MYSIVSIPYEGGDSVEAPMRRQRTVVPRPTQKLPSQKIGSSDFDSRDYLQCKKITMIKRTLEKLSYGFISSFQLCRKPACEARSAESSQ